jgi:hypothetical protein
MPRTTLNKEDFNTVPDSRTVFKHGDDIYYINAQSGQGQFGKCIKARPAFGPQAQDLLIHWIGLNATNDRFISVEDSCIRVRRQVAAQLLCDGDDGPSMHQQTAPQEPRQRRATADMPDDQLSRIDFADMFIDWGSASFIDHRVPVEEAAHVEDRPKNRLRRKGLAARGLVAKAPTPGIDEPLTPAVGTGDAAEVMPLAVTPSTVAGAVDAGGDEVTPSAAAGAILPMELAEGADDAMEVDGAGAIGTLETALALALGTAPVRSVGLSSQSMQVHASRIMSATSDASGGSSAVTSSASASTSQAAVASYGSDGCDGGGVDGEGGNTVRGGDAPVYNGSGGGSHGEGGGGEGGGGEGGGGEDGGGEDGGGEDGGGEGGDLGGAGLGDLGGDLGGAATRAPDGARVQVRFVKEGGGEALYRGTVVSSSSVDGVWMHTVKFDDGETYEDMHFDELILEGQKKRGRRNSSRRGRSSGKRQKKGGYTILKKSAIRMVLGDNAVPRLAAPRQGELPLSLCWEETMHTIFYRLGMATRLGLMRMDFHNMYDPFVDTPDDFVVDWSRARGVLLRDVTSLLCQSPGGRERALIALTGARLFAVRARIKGDGFDAPHVFFFDAERRHLMTNWHTSRVVEFDDHDLTSVCAARTAIKHVDYAFLHDKRIEIQQLYEASLL